MSTSFYDQLTREHPAYQAGYLAGVDVGTRMALDVITAEWAAQADAGSAMHEYAAGRLDAVARIVGAMFRNGTNR